MSDPLANMEIQDVLSSIRRLVSEDSRRKPAGGDEPPVDTQNRDTSDTGAAEEPGKLVLTEALRVGTGGEAVPEGQDTLRQAVAGDGFFEEGDAVPEIEVRDAAASGPDADNLVDWEDAPGEAEAGSLEDTIAELEAAVAGIGGEFEPDGSEVSADRDADAELDEVFEDGFAVDQGDDPDVAELSQPVTGGGAEDWLEAGPATGADAGEAEEDSEVLVLRASEDRPGADPAAEFGRADQAAGLRDATAEESPFDAEVTADETEDDPAAAAMPAFRARRDEATEAAEPSDTLEPATPDTEVSEAVAPAGSGNAPLRRLHLRAGEAVSATQSEDRGAPEPSESDGQGLADEQGGDDGGAEALEPGLFDAGGAEGALDMDLLRDLVAEVLREELKGPLGERITRNVRALVRREIQRALETGEYD